MWKLFFTVEIQGDPVATARVRFSKQGVAYKPSKTRLAMNRRITLIQKQMRLDGISTSNLPIRVTIQFIHKRPKRLLAKKYDQSKLFLKTTKPDVDNLVKMMLDSATQALLWADDNQICQLEVGDFYACENNPNPRTIMTVYIPIPNEMNFDWEKK
jgi:Holliday junction resolvase RusA-like endonuclease